MNVQKGKYAWMVKIGEKGQFVIPKEARDLFDLQPGNEILVLGDENRGLAILPNAGFLVSDHRTEGGGKEPWKRASASAAFRRRHGLQLDIAV